MTDWTDSLQQASFRGVPFGVLGDTARFGRRLALHEYPNRDTPWPEDMGRQPRRYSITGFLVENSAIYGGGDVIGQRDALIGAAETKGSADLVHPTYGRLKVDLFDLNVVERWDAGRYFELSFALVESGQRQFPASATATGDAVGKAADGAKAAVTADLAGKLGAALPKIPNLGPLSSVAGRFSAAANQVAHDATSLLHVATQLQGNFGRFAGGAGVSGGVSSIGALIGKATRLRADIAGKATILAGLPGALGSGARTPSDLAGAAFALTASVRGATAAPRDAVRLLGQLGRFGRP